MTITTNRRAIVKGAAWATPVVLATSAVPAFAASKPCSTALFTQMSYGTAKENLYGSDGATSSNTASAMVGSTSYVATITTARSGEFDETPAIAFELLTGGSGDAYYSNYRTYQNYWNDKNGIPNLGAKTYGGTNNAMMLSMIAPTTGTDSAKPIGQLVTVTFDKPVSEVEFTVIDIDANWVDKNGIPFGTAGGKYGFRDKIVVSTSGGSTVTGTTNDTSTGLTVTNDSATSVTALAGEKAGNVSEADYKNDPTKGTATFKICGSVTQFTIGYYSKGTTNGLEFNTFKDKSWTQLDQRAFVSPLKIKANCTPCQ